MIARRIDGRPRNIIRAAISTLCLALAAILPGSDAGADQSRAPAIRPAIHVSVQGYGKQNLECLRWTDGCVLCIEVAAGKAECSTPGIACEPRGVTCKAKRIPP